MTRGAGRALPRRILFRGSTSTPLKEWFTAFSFGELYSRAQRTGARSEQRLAKISKYRLAIELIAACYGCLLTCKAACSMASNYRNRSR